MQCAERMLHSAWFMPARIIPTACARSAMFVLAIVYVCFFEKTIHEEYISIGFDKFHVVHEEPEHKS